MVLLSQTDNKPNAKMIFGGFETLKGQVKQVIETGVNLRGSPFLMEYNDTSIFDKKGQQIEFRASPGARRFEISRPKYDHGNEIAVNPLGWRVSKDIYRLNNYGQIVQSLHYNIDGFYERVVYTYDTAGRLSQSEIYSKQNILNNKIIYGYDKNGYLIEQCSYQRRTGKDSLENKTQYRYPAFDKNGNWIIQVSCSDDRPIQAGTDTIRRKITYY
jgi:hypothetical protein